MAPATGGFTIAKTLNGPDSVAGLPDAYTVEYQLDGGDWIQVSLTAADVATPNGELTATNSPVTDHVYLVNPQAGAKYVLRGELVYVDGGGSDDGSDGGAGSGGGTAIGTPGLPVTGSNSGSIALFAPMLLTAGGVAVGLPRRLAS